LTDDQTVGSFQFSEKDFVVLMVTKQKKPAPKPEPKPVQPTTQPAAQSTSQPTTSTQAPASSATTQPVDTDLATGEAYNNAVQNLVDMGFEINQVKAAMRAAFNNPDRAAEYLMTVPIISY
jgi:UV excision repair protein RAD23